MVGLSINEGTIEILRRVVFSTVCLLLATGCASIVDGRRETVSFSSDPSGAQLIINGKMIGVTPASIFLERSDYDKANVIFKKEGYQDQQATIQTSLNMWFWGKVLCGGLIGSSTDAASGAMRKFSPNSYYVSMAPLKASQAEWDRFMYERNVRRFVLFTYDHLVSDLAEDGGEHLVSLLQLLSIHNDQTTKAKVRLQDLSHSTENPLAFANAVLRNF